MPDNQSLFAVLRQTVDPKAADAIEKFVRDAPDEALNRVNALTFAKTAGIHEETAIAAFLHAARLGIFDMSWNVLCPGCGGVLDAGASLKTIQQQTYSCSLCGAGYEPTLDDMVEVTFTITPRVRRIAAHDPDSLSMWDYDRQFFWGSGVDLPDNFDEIIEEVVIDSIDLPPGERASLSLQLPAEFVIVFEPVTHTAQFIDVKGEPTRERQNLSLVFNEVHPHHDTIEMQPGPLRLTLDNRSTRRVLPAVWIANTTLHDMLARRRPFLTANRLLSNQTFRDLYRTDTLDIDQRLKITSLTFLFTDLKGSTELYERVGDLMAYDLVKEHFRVLNDIVGAEAGAVVKTIGDAVMATFQTPHQAVAAALQMREEMHKLNQARGREDLLLKIGIHEGPCLAVMLNDRQDYFGQTVNIASRVQNLAISHAIFATGAVVEDPDTSELMESRGLHPTQRRTALRGMQDEFSVYEIP